MKTPGVLLEIGPGNVLATLARQHKGASKELSIVSTLSDGFSGEGDALSLTSAQGAMWLAGAALNWSTVHGGERRLRVSLPTYPFERRRFWLDSPEPQQMISAATEIQTPRETESATTQFVRTEESPAVSPAPTNQTSSIPRSVRLRGALSELFQDLSGVSISEREYGATFLDLGFDSLFLTQVTQSLQTKFAVKITFRQLLGDLASIEALSDFLDSKLSADVFSDTAPAAAAPSVATSAAASAPAAVGVPSTLSPPTGPVAASAVEQLLRGQLQAMNQLFSPQLAAIHGN